MLNEKEINYLEKQIPELAENALKQAYWQSLATGESVLIAKEGKLIEVFADGKKSSNPLRKLQIAYNYYFSDSQMNQKFNHF